MIITEEEKRRPLPKPPLAPADYSSQSDSAAPSSSATSASGPQSSDDWPAPPPYSPSDPTSSALVPSTPSSSQLPTSYDDPPEPSIHRAAQDQQVDLLDGDASAYSSGPSVSSGPSTLPIAYPSGSSSAPGATADPIPDLPRQNHLRIHRDHSPISETFVIDPSLPAPPGTTGKNLELSSKTAPVFARVYVVEGRDLKGRVEMSARSETGPCKLAVAEFPRTARVSLHVSSNSGWAEVYLPPTFNGPLTIRTRTGFVALNSALQAHCRLLEETSEVRRYWVGYSEGVIEWQECVKAGEEWIGDECEVRTETGPVRVGYWEGVGVVEKVVSGFVKRIFG